MFTLTGALNITREEGLYAIEFSAPDGEAVVYLDGQRIVGVTGACTPDWSRLLLRRGLEPLDVSLAAVQDTCLLTPLLDKGLLSEVQASEVLHSCVTHALLPLGWQQTTFTARPVTVDELPFQVPELGTDVELALYDVSWWSMMVPPALRDLCPSDRVRTLPIRAVHAEMVKHGEVYFALMSGMTLGKAAQCLALRWDELLQAVADLVTHDLVVCPVVDARE